MDFLHGVGSFLTFVIIGLGPWLLAVYLISKLFFNLKLLNQSVIDLQKRVKELEKERKK